MPSGTWDCRLFSKVVVAPPGAVTARIFLMLGPVTDGIPPNDAQVRWDSVAIYPETETTTTTTTIPETTTSSTITTTTLGPTTTTQSTTTSVPATTTTTVTTTTIPDCSACQNELGICYAELNNCRLFLGTCNDGWMECLAAVGRAQQVICDLPTTTVPSSSTITVTTSIPSTTTTTLSPPPPCSPSDIVISGLHPDGLQQSFPDGARIDASQATFTYDLDTFPVIVTGGNGIRWCGGSIVGNVPGNESWEYYHQSPYPAGIMVDGPVGVTIDRVSFDTLHDAVRWQEGESTSYTLRNSYFTNIRDDCVDNHWQNAGTIEDNLFNGCYVWISTRADTRPRYPDRIIQARSNLVWMKDMPGPHPSDSNGNPDGHGTTFKWDADGAGPMISLHNNIIRLDSIAATGNGLLSRIRIASCSNNIFVWTGSGPFNEDLGADPVTGEPCFSVTTDVGVWNAAVVEWLSAHGG